ncbi:fumarylacetoacetate hydrolase family protein [Williamsia soli]|uniref:fumarylacetoacetate hydrolase family protein n=1 Tax=Williamsia soli TaxID=364929 RepID=UPI001A9E8F34|nr:fumarylacetoacetate hydrolase family protein [Williamsia soli]
MRLYSTAVGIAREDSPGLLSVLDLEHSDVGDLLRRGELEVARNAEVKSIHPLGELTLRAPVASPGQMFIAGLNYLSHAEEARAMLAEMGREFPAVPTTPTFELLPTTTADGPESTIEFPNEAPAQVDYEGELTVVIGRTASDVPPEHAWDHVAGLTIANDLTARDVQMRALTGDSTVTVAESKSYATFKPMGPCLVTADEFSLPIDLRLRTRVNGDVRQDDRTSNVLFDCAALVSALSAQHRLEPGDVILTGTPSGAGVFSKVFLTEGDVIEIEIDRIGTLRNQVAR